MCPSALTGRVPQVPGCLECPSSLSALSARALRVPECFECLSALVPEYPSAYRVSTESAYRVPEQDKILYPYLSCQKCCVNRIIFVPKLLDKNCSLTDNTYIFKY